MSAKLDIARGLKLDPDYVGGGTFALLAKKGAGKSYTARVMAEEFWEAKVPFVLLDPMGATWGLRSTSDGKGSGIPVAIFGGKHGDAPLERGGGAVIADLVVDEGLSMVLDMSELGSHAAEREFAMAFFDRLYRRNSELVHLLVDEADLFAPQNPQAGDQALLGITENIVRRGRNHGIGITLITQRPAVLNKNVLTQVDGLVAMRITGKTDRDAVNAWVKGHADTDASEVHGSLSKLATGEGWWWIPELDILKRVQVREARTFDSSPTRTRGGSRREPKTFADIDIGAIEGKMADTIERQKASDPKELRKQVRDLEKRLAAAEAAKPEPQVERIEVPVLGDEELSRLERAGEQLAEAAETSRAAAAVVAERLDVGRDASRGPGSDASRGSRQDGSGQRPGSPSTRTAGGEAARSSRARAAPPAPAVDSDGELSKGATGLLETLARRHPMRPTRAQLATLAGRSIKSSSFTAQVSELKRETLVDERDGLLELSEAGAAVGGVDDHQPQDPAEVLATWRRALPSGPRRMLDQLVAEPGLDRDELADHAGFSTTSSSVGAHLKVLRDNGLVVRDGALLYPSELVAP